MEEVVEAVFDGPATGVPGMVAKVKQAEAESTDPSELKAVILKVNFFPKSEFDKAAETLLRVGMLRTAGSFAVLTSMLGVPVDPSSLKTA